jgi:hypothetical protein
MRIYWPNKRLVHSQVRHCSTELAKRGFHSTDTYETSRLTAAWTRNIKVHEMTHKDAQTDCASVYWTLAANNEYEVGTCRKNGHMRRLNFLRKGGGREKKKLTEVTTVQSIIRYLAGGSIFKGRDRNLFCSSPSRTISRAVPGTAYTVSGATLMCGEIKQVKMFAVPDF